MDLFSLVARLTLDRSDYEQGIDKSLKSGKKLSSKLGNAFKNIKKASALMGAGVLAGGAALVGMAKKAASAADHIDKMSQKIGISREAYQELDFVMSQSGTSVDNLQMGIKTLTAKMDAFAAGNKDATATFEKLGVAVKNSDGTFRSQEDVFFDTVAALQGVEDQTEKSRLATELFGKSGLELMPLLNGAAGSMDEMRKQAHDLGLVMSDDAIDAGVKFTDTVDQVKRSFDAIINQIGVSVMPVIQKVLEWVLKHMPEIQKVITVAFGVIKSVIAAVIKFISEKLIPIFDDLVKFVTDVFAKDWDSAWQDIKSAFEKIWDNVSGFFAKVFNAAVDVIKKIDWRQLGKDIWDWIKSAFSFISTWATNTFSKAKQAILTKIDWKKLGQDVWDWIIEAFANAVSWASDLWTEVKNEIEDIDWKQVGKDIWDLITKGFMSHSIADWFVEKFTGAKDDTEKKIDWKGLGEDILNLATGPIGGIVELLFGFFEQAWNDIQDIKWAEIGDNIWSAITGAIGDIGDWIVGKIKDAVNSVIKLLNKMIGKVEGGVNKVIRGINEKLKVDVDFGKMPGWLGGGSLGGIHWSPNLKEAEFGRIKELATGGFLSEGQTAVVGERRPEMLRMVNGHALVTPIGGIQPGDRLGGGKSYTYAPVIYQQPGESSEELAERVQKVFVRWQQQEDAVWA